ncbi:hypothetical protein [Natronosalvus vescus]|uniref:hypothetical protein n=1 Tax=Natronosalvus vescus TaxID=2953881 RepID=UPI0020913F2F|nr:hypothetical protein [Natronosalvus vescus]
MATSDSQPVPGPITLRQLSTVDDHRSVRHLDELSDDALERFLELADGNTTVTIDETDLAVGEVIVFTDYYLISSV